jgi:hypothetical protein
MPNYCYQTLVITGEKEDLAPFANKLLASWRNYKENSTESQYELLDTFYPVPDDVYSGNFDSSDPEASALKGQKADEYHDYVAAWTQEQIEMAKNKYGDFGWLEYYWRTRNWGSKWADCRTTIDEHDDTHLKISYISAWSPLVPGILHISNDYPLLTFSVDYHDEMYNYPDSGAKMKGGEILSEWQESEEEYKKNVSKFDGVT